MNYRVVVTSCLDANILVEALCTNTALYLLEEHAMGSIHPHRKIKHQVTPHWTHLIIDEVNISPNCCVFATKLLEQAAQGSEPELLVPISVVLTKAEFFDNGQQRKISNGTTSYSYPRLSATPQLVLCGDPHQCQFFKLTISIAYGPRADSFRSGPYHYLSRSIC